jgi:hypothetical protein
MTAPGLIERAFELARTRGYPTIDALERKLTAVGYSAVRSAST